MRVVSVGLALVFAACSGGHSTATSPSAVSSSTAASGSFAVASADLGSGRWPTNSTCDGADDPPDLHWTGGPAAVSYALQVFDPDAPNGGFAHWMLANEPPNLREPTPGTGVSGKNDFGKEGYNGPCPPHGSTHHYVVTVYAVDRMLSLPLLYRHADFERALQGRVLAEASLTATYGR
jgi:Raf kinase inhibitor-like YbhB/YbcL family protein